MIRGSAHVLDIAGTQTFLRTGRASKLKFNIAQKMILERIHSSWCKQHGRIPFGHQHITGTDGVAFGGKKVEVLLADFVSFHCFSRAGERR